MNWKTHDRQYLLYHSFEPLSKLMNCFETPAVQLYAIWAILHVCSKNGKLLKPLYRFLI